jgi:hypothetical protein
MAEEKTKFFDSSPRQLRLLFTVGLIACASVFLYPVSTATARNVEIVLPVFLYALGFFAFPKKTRIILYAPPLVVILWLAAGFATGGRETDAAKIRQDYIAAMRDYDGAPYVWGGENGFGIDCSGLIRKGMIRALFRHGIVGLQPSLVRQAFDIWRNDTTAAGLKAGYGGRTEKLFDVKNVNLANDRKFLPGDFMVLEGGQHTMAYIGDHTWIEADPYFQKVVEVKAPADSLWFKKPAAIIRWVVLK